MSPDPRIPDRPATSSSAYSDQALPAAVPLNLEGATVVSATDQGVAGEWGGEVGMVRALNASGLIAAGLGAALVVFGIGVGIYTFGTPPVTLALAVANAAIVVVGVGLVVLGFVKFRPTTTLYEHAAIRRGEGGDRIVRYEDVRSVVYYRHQNRHKGAYINTSVVLSLSLEDDHAHPLKITFAVKDKSIKTGLFSSRLEPTPAPPDEVAELIATYAASAMMARIEARLQCSVGKVYFDTSTLMVKSMLSTSVTPWEKISVATLSPAGALVVSLVDGSELKLTVPHTTPNQTAMLMIIEAFTRRPAQGDIEGQSAGDAAPV